MSDHDPTSGLLDRMLTCVSEEGEWLARGLPNGSRCSVMIGAAGIACGLLWISRARGRNADLDVAAAWARRAEHDLQAPDAFADGELGISSEMVSGNSPFYSPSGVHAVAALVAAERGEVALLALKLADFVDCSPASGTTHDLVLGRCGTVLACSLLLDAASTSAEPGSDGSNDLQEAVRRVRELGNTTLTEIWTRLDPLPPIGTREGIGALGMAHGWAGACFCALAWTKVTGAPLPSGVGRRVDELARQGEQRGRGLRWRITVEGPAEYMTSWCNGSSGFVHLFATAHEVTGEGRYATLAERAAVNAWEEGDEGWTMCCGAAGRAYSLLRMHRLSGDQSWHARARTLAHRAAESCVRAPFLAQSLYHGEFGVAVLGGQIEAEPSASMPFFESAP